MFNENVDGNICVLARQVSSDNDLCVSIINADLMFDRIRVLPTCIFVRHGSGENDVGIYMKYVLFVFKNMLMTKPHGGLKYVPSPSTLAPR